MQIFVRPIVLPGEVFAILRRVGHPPVFGKNLFLQMGDPKGVHQGYHEMTYTKFFFAKYRGWPTPIKMTKTFHGETIGRTKICIKYDF